MPLLEISQRTDDWLNARIGRITASLAAACLGLDPYISRQKAWRSILGMEKKSENRHMRWGVQFEAAARLDYERISGNIVEETGLWVHPVCDWLAASPDGLVGKDGLVEIKCPTIPPPRVPVQHRIQALIQEACTERKWCDYFSWGASGQKYMARVHRAGIPNLIVRLQEFYESYIVTGIEPPRRKSRGKLSGRSQR